MSSIQSVLPVLVLVDSNSTGAGGKIVFSAGRPRSAVVLFDDAPPEIHDFTKAELGGNRMQGYSVILQEKTRATRPDRKVLAFRDKAACAAYRPGKDELAMVFSADGEKPDSTVWRINPMNGTSLPSVYFDNPSAVVYSSDGELLAVGGANGIVTVFRLAASGEAVEIRTIDVGGAVRSMVFEELEHQLYVATSCNMLVSVFYEVEDDAAKRRGVIDDEGEQITNMSLNALAYSPSGNLLAVGGVGNEVWVFNPLKDKGGMIRIRACTRIVAVQFSAAADTLVAVGDQGVELISYSLDSEHLPVFERNTVTFRSIVNLMGCHHYGEFLFIGTLLCLPADSDS